MQSVEVFVGGYGILPYPRHPLKSSHRIHGSFWRKIFSHGFHRCSQIFRLRFCLLICAHLCLSVGGFLCQNVLCVPRVLWEHSLCLLCWCCRGSCTSVVVFSHGFHGFPQMVRLRYWRRGYGRMPYPPNQCASVSICGRHFSARRFCVFRVFCGEFVHCFVGAALLVHLRQVHPLRVPPESAPSAIRFRPPPNQIASAIRSDSVRRPIRFRSPPNQIASAARCHK